MKKVVLAAGLMITTVCCLQAQKVDLDRFRFGVSYQRLPTQSVPLHERTFGTRVIYGPTLDSEASENIVNESINIDGWKRVSAYPTVGIDMKLESFEFKGLERKSRTQESKDRNGIVTRTTYYYVEAYYSGAGVCKYIGPSNPKQPSESELAEIKQKEEQKANNRFLANATLDTKASKTNPENNTERTIGLYRSMTYRSDETTDGDPSEYFRDNKEAIKADQLRAYIDLCIKSVNSGLNNMYGYSTVNDAEFLWILNSRDHPEYQVQQEAIQAVKALFQTMKADEPLDKLSANLQPLIDYFDSLKTKYAGDNKPDKKMRYSAYYNLAKIYFYLDQPEKSIKEAEGLIANGYDERDGEKIIESAQKLQSLFESAKVSSTHNLPLK